MLKFNDETLNKKPSNIDEGISFCKLYTSEKFHSKLMTQISNKVKTVGLNGGLQGRVG